MYKKLFIKSSVLLLLIFAINTVNAAPLPGEVVCYTHNVLLGTAYDFDDDPFESCREIFVAHVAASENGEHNISGTHSSTAGRAENNKNNPPAETTEYHVIDPSCFDGHGYYE